MSSAREGGAALGTPARRCTGCGREQPRAARFCAMCGAAVGVIASFEERRVVVALAIAVGGTLAALLVAAFVTQRAASGVVNWLVPILLACVAGGAARALGPDGPRQSLGGRATPRWIAIGVATGALTFAVAWLIVTGMAALVSEGPVAEPISAAAWIAVVCITPPAEEWLCRGVVWIAAQSVLSTTATIALSAALFAILHGLNGAGVAEFPHRFAVGVVLGVLRARTGSLVPSIAAHATHNALAASL